MATWKVLIAHAEEEEHLAEKLAEPLRKIGYDVAHQGTVLVGESVIEEASKILSLGGPVVLCGTVRAMGTSWATRVVRAASNHSGVHIFVVQMEEEAYVEAVSFDGVIARFWQDLAKALSDLQTSLSRYYPLDDGAAADPLRGTAAEDRYRELLQKSCDIIDLANLPEQDRHIAHRQIELRRLYVPLRVWVESEVGEETDKLYWKTIEKHRMRQMRAHLKIEILTDDSQREDTLRKKRQRAPIGERLTKARRIVVLGGPGSGKTTLTRWIATAYLLRLRRDSDWRKLPDIQTLPDEEWLPIVIRCRDLDHKCLTGSLENILQSTLRKSELTEGEANCLNIILRQRLTRGTALLIVDGLDEITDPFERAGFCQQLERIHQAYLQAPIIATSRIVGYREVGHQLGPEFEHVTLADLTSEEKDDFVSRWCALTERPDRSATAEKELISDIHSSDRIEGLTGNPMLLTTMALVKRKVGKLPTRRADLYWEAVQVLLNWRSEIDKSIYPNEALPQLAYLAYAMCDSGVQQLRRDEMLALLEQMRSQYPSLHTIHRQPPEIFLHQAEAHTGIVLQAGHKQHLGMTVPVYEFRHLTFQEYFAARALVDGYFPGRDPRRRLSEYLALLAGRTTDETELTKNGKKELAVVESWRETLRLCTAICHNDDVDDVLSAIVTPKENEAGMTKHARTIMAMLCLADEPNASDKVADQIFELFVQEVTEDDGYRRGKTEADIAANQLIGTRWTTRLQTCLMDEYFRNGTIYLDNIGGLFAMIGAARVPEGADAANEWLEQHINQLCEGTERDAAEIALVTMQLGYKEKIRKVPGLINALLDRLDGSTPMAIASASALGCLAGGNKRYLTQNWKPTYAQIDRILKFILVKSADPNAVRHLTRVLNRKRISIAFDPLIAWIEHSDPKLRQAVTSALGEIGSERAIGPLIVRLDDPEAGVRSAAAFALGNIGSDLAVEPLLARLDDAEVAVRRISVRALGRIGSDLAVEPLLARLDDAEVAVRRISVRALGRIGSDLAVEPLLARLDDAEVDVRSAAAFALGNIGSDLAVEPLLARLDDAEVDVRSAAAFALGRIGSDLAVEPLLARLDDAEVDVRSDAAFVLGRIGSEQAVEPLLARLDDAEVDVRIAAAGALGNIGSDLAVEPLLARLDDAEADVRRISVRALGRIGSYLAVEPLLVRLDDAEVAVRSDAAFALGNIGSDLAVEPLLTRLDDAEVDVRSAAAGALGRIGSEQAIEPLLARLDDTEAEIRGAVAYALGEIYFMFLNDLPAAVTYYNLAITNIPKDGKPHIALGHIYQIGGELEKARSEYQTFIKLDSDSKAIHASLAVVLRKLVSCHTCNVG